MKYGIHGIFLFTFIVGIQPSLADEFSPDSIKSIMVKVAKYSFKTWGNGTAAGLDRDWSRGTIMTGIMGLYRTTRDRQWLDSVDNWGNRWSWTWGGGGGDNFCAIQTFCERYIDDPLPQNVAKYQPSQTALDNILKQPVNNIFGWQDAVYMGLPDFAMMGAITGKQSYFDSLNSMWKASEKKFMDPTYKLWYWSTAESFKTTDKGFPQFWGPGNAWVLGGLVRALKYLPEDSKYRADWEKTFVTFCDTIRAKQQPDGFWRTSLYEPTEYPNPESSCTAFFAYAMALGVSWGILDAQVYAPTIRKAWSALVRVVNASGKVGYGQPWSNQPGAPQPFTEIPEGHGAFLLAGEGVYAILDSLGTVANRTDKSKPASPAQLKTKGQRWCLSGKEQTLLVPANARGVTVFNLQGRVVWRQAVASRAEDRNVSLPGRVLSQGLLFARFE